MKRAIRRIGGFSLIEIMIVMVIAAAAVTLGVTWLNTERARTLRGAAADDTAREVATMARALDTYIATASSLPASGAFDVAHADLVAAGLLPPDYAMRDVGGTKFLTSPLGQAYSLRAIKQGTKYRGAVLVSAGIAATAFRKIGVDPTEQGAFDFATVMMRRAREKFLITSAVVRTGQATTDLPLSGFSADLTDLLGGPAAQPVLAALVGFSELNTNPDIKVSVDPESLAGIGGEDYGAGSFCYMAGDDACGTGYDRVVDYQMCERWGMDEYAAGEPTLVGIKSPVGDISVTRAFASLGENMAKIGIPLTFNYSFSNIRLSGQNGSCNAGSYGYYADGVWTMTFPPSVSGKVVRKTVHYCFTSAGSNGAEFYGNQEFLQYVSYRESDSAFSMAAGLPSTSQVALAIGDFYVGTPALTGIPWNISAPGASQWTQVGFITKKGASPYEVDIPVISKGMQMSTSNAFSPTTGDAIDYSGGAVYRLGWPQMSGGKNYSFSETVKYTSGASTITKTATCEADVITTRRNASGEMSSVTFSGLKQPFTAALPAVEDASYIYGATYRQYNRAYRVRAPDSYYPKFGVCCAKKK